MPTMNGYGPHSCVGDGNYDFTAQLGSPKRRKRLTVGLDIAAGNATLQVRRSGTAQAFVAAAYTKEDGSSAAVAIAADATVTVDVTGKDFRIVGAGGFSASVSLELDTDL